MPKGTDLEPIAFNYYLAAAYTDTLSFKFYAIYFKTMKKGMLFFAAAALFMAAACNTYTTSTDPDDLGTGYGLSGNKEGTGNTASSGVAEANNNATFDNPAATGVPSDSATAEHQSDSVAANKPANVPAPVKNDTNEQ
jgi:hypothetical protein